MTHEVLKSCRSKMTALAHDVCDVHRASSLCIKTCWQSLYRIFPTGGKSPPSPPKFYSLPPKVISTQLKNKDVIFSYSHCSCTIFVLIAYSFETQTMLILILIDVHYSQNAVLNFEKFSNCQNYSSSGSHHLVKKIPPAVFTTF